MNRTGWSKGLEVTSGGEGVVSHAGLALLRRLAGKTGLTGGLSRALASPRLLIHDRGRVTADLACLAEGVLRGRALEEPVCPCGSWTSRTALAAIGSDQPPCT